MENDCVRELSQYHTIIPEECIDDYVWAITHTYVGRIGSSAYYSRTDFYANVAAGYIPDMFQGFNDRMGAAFMKCLRASDDIQRRMRTPSKLKRVRNLATIVHDKVSGNFEDKAILELLITEGKEEDFYERLK